MNSPEAAASPEPSTRESRDTLTPRQVLQLLKDGNQRFLSGKLVKRDLARQVRQTAAGQYPVGIVLSCIDSRVPVQVIFDQGIGDLFDAGVAGNVLNDDILGCMEFACKMAGSKLVLVMGHTACGAVKGACDGAELGHVTQLLEKIAPAVQATPTAEGEARNSENVQFVNGVALANVRLTLERIRERSPILRTMEEQREIDIVGAMYDVSTGKVSFFDEADPNQGTVHG